MSTDVTKDGLVGERPGRYATTGVNAGRPRRPRPELVVPEALPTSYYDQPVLTAPTWRARDIAGYLFLGGLAGASSVVATGAEVRGLPGLARVSKLGAAGASALSMAALVHDLGRPARFVNMLRVFKPTSPMSVGSWLLAGYVPAATAAAVCEVGGVLPMTGRVATGTAALLGPAVATYTGALVANTAVPAWHDGHREMPVVFGASGAAAAAGLGLLASPHGETGPPRRLAVIASVAELIMHRRMRLQLHPTVRTAYDRGAAGRLRRTATVLSAAGLAGALVAGRSPVAARLAGAALLAGSACTRFAVFRAGVQSAGDPAATVTPQRERQRR